MKIDIYFDVYPWTINMDRIWPTFHPGDKPEKATRYKVSCEIPDPCAPDIEIEGKVEAIP